MDIYFHGIWRMDWGLGNPNKTAVLVGMLMLSVWWLFYIHRWGFWVAWACFVSLGVCLVHTASRGGLVGTTAGGFWLLWNIPRPWLPWRTITVAAGIIIIFVSAFYIRTYSRYIEGLGEQDRSITNRLTVWRAAPQMMSDAPNGWGVGNSGNAYLQWYQPLNHHEVYRTLVNSHLTWLVELGWPLRLVYLFAWTLVILVCWPVADGLFRAMPLAIWIVFGIGGIFSSVAESVWLWVVPSVALAAALRWRWRDCNWPNQKLWWVAFGAPTILLVMLFALGQSTQPREIRGSAEQVVLGSGNPKTWVIVDYLILGSDFGRTLREHMPPYTVGVVTGAKPPDSMKGDVMIICGKPSDKELALLASLAVHFQKVVLLNPAFYPQEFKLPNPFPVDVVYGEFSRSPAIPEWRTRVTTHAVVMPGVGDFVPDWPLRVLSTSSFVSAYADH